LRTLLVVVTLLSIALAFHVRSTERQRRGLQAIRKYGGWVQYGFQYPSGDYSYKGFDPNARSAVPQWLLDWLGVDFFHNVVEVSLNFTENGTVRQENRNRSDDALQYLVAFPDLRVLLLQETQVSDDAMKYLAELKKLEYLFMWDAYTVSDVGVAHLADLKNLRYVHLTTSRISDKSLPVFASLPKLHGLCLQFSDFSDEGLKSLAPMVRLTSLWVCGPQQSKSQITDAGLKQLDDLKRLTELGIQNTHITPEGVKAFKKAVPGCKVTR
jgi:hypothetical protein